MQIDKTVLDRLLSLDDSTLAKTINMLCLAAGIPSEKASAAVENIRLIRASLSNATDEDIKKAVNLIGEDKASAIMNILGGNQK